MSLPYKPLIDQGLFLSETPRRNQLRYSTSQRLADAQDGQKLLEALEEREEVGKLPF